MRHRFTASHADRLDKVIAAQTKLSRKRAKAIVKHGGVRVDGVRARFESQRVDAGAVVEVRTNASAYSASAADPGPDGRSGGSTLRLVERYRQGGLLVVDKPAGLPTQPTRQGHRRHLYGLLSATERYVGLHHRLDTPASGLVLLTLERDLNRAIAAGFQEGRIRRTYLAVVVGEPADGAGRWASPIDGKPAATRWRVLSASGGMAVIEAELETGRTHQIRRHAAEAGHPILGDRRYGGAAGRGWDRLALHARALRFHHPRLGQDVTVSSPPPADLRALLVRAGWTAEDSEE